MVKEDIAFAKVGDLVGIDDVDFKATALVLSKEELRNDDVFFECLILNAPQNWLEFRMIPIYVKKDRKWFKIVTA
jgi:hypothetical protein